MSITKRMKVRVLATASAFLLAGAAFLGLTPSGVRAASLQPHDIALTRMPECEAASGWTCCVWRGYWECQNNAKPKESLKGTPECIAVAPGDPIPTEIQRDLDRQKPKK